MGVENCTPGEWMAGERHVYALNKAGVNRFYTSVSGGFTDEGSLTRTSDEELQANTFMLAASKRMYEALEAAEDWLSGWASAEAQITIIRQALAAARGEKS